MVHDVLDVKDGCNGVGMIKMENTIRQLVSL